MEIDVFYYIERHIKTLEFGGNRKYKQMKNGIIFNPRRNNKIAKKERSVIYFPYYNNVKIIT